FLDDGCKAQIILPVDFSVASNANKSDEVLIKRLNELQPKDVALDLGLESTKAICNVLRGVKMLFWNGPLGYYEDEFETDRLMVRTNVTGEIGWGSLQIRPQVGWAHYQDRQDAYVDSLGIDIPSQTVTIGRLRAGPAFVWSQQSDNGTVLEFGTSLRAVWDYEGEGRYDVNAGRLTSGGNPVRADGDISLSLAFASGLKMSVEAGLDGLGRGDFNARSGRLSLIFPFGGASRNGVSVLPGDHLQTAAQTMGGCDGGHHLNFIGDGC
ncbi:MAG: phosphoglycerate kinase, partial [Pseudomonadota bacterium]